MKDTILLIYNKLFESYGHQGWWPLSGLNMPLKEQDNDWNNYVKFTGEENICDFKQNWPRHVGVEPKDDRDRFEIITGAVLTQNTSWTNVERSIYNLNRNNVNNMEKIIRAENLAELIKSSGYHNQKSQRLKLIGEYFSGKSLETFFKEENAREMLLTLKGIGPETADSILLYSGHVPVFVIDAYTKRIFSRISGEKKEKTYDEWQKIFMNTFSGREEMVKIFREYHGLIVKHGKEYCRAKPVCADCIVREDCVNFTENMIK